MDMKGWNINGDGVACNTDPVLGGIIDSNIVSGKWFIIFNDDDLETAEGIDSRDEAFKVFEATIKAKYWLE